VTCCNAVDHEAAWLVHRSNSEGLAPLGNARGRTVVSGLAAAGTRDGYVGSMNQNEARERFVRARSAVLATEDPREGPHLVPIVYAIHNDMIAFAVDHKPKRTKDLRRLRNIAADDRVCVLVDHYEEDWSRLWWARADGRATIVEDEETQEHWITRLAERYEQYRERRPEGPVVAITVERWRGWSYEAG
jgi:PPOX class probable F420-dependent enzyme